MDIPIEDLLSTLDNLVLVKELTLESNGNETKTLSLESTLSEGNVISKFRVTSPHKIYSYDLLSDAVDKFYSIIIK